jgi:hypothetical protein
MRTYVNASSVIRTHDPSSSGQGQYAPYTVQPLLLASVLMQIQICLLVGEMNFIGDSLALIVWDCQPIK